MAKKKKKKDTLPFNPEVDTGEERPIRASVAIGDGNDKFSEYPSCGLTPRRLAAIFREADEGSVRAQMELFEEIEEKDTHVFSQLQTRKLAVTSLDWEIQPASDDERDKEIAEFIEKQIKKIGNFREILFDMLDAIGKGVSVSEIEWDINKTGQNVISKIAWIHPKKLMWDYRTDEMLICTRDYPSGIKFPDNKFVVHIYKARSGHTSRAGILRVISWMYLFKNYDLKDWVAFCEVFGMPLRLGKYDASASEEDKQALMEAIINLGTDAAGIVPSTTDINFIESNKTSTAEIYEKLARYCDEQNSKAILGQTLTADSGGGSYAQGKVHGEVRHDLTEADAASLADTIQRDIIRPLVLFNFGSDAELPTLQFDCKEADDLKATVEIYKILTCDMGLPIAKKHLYKKFAIPEPEEGDEVTKPNTSSNPVLPPSADISRKAYKAEGTNSVQGYVDVVSETSTKHSGKMFATMLEPILKLIDKSDSLETIQMVLSDKEKVKELYDQMNSQDLEDLIKQGIYITNLLGRSEA